MKGERKRTGGKKAFCGFIGAILLVLSNVAVASGSHVSCGATITTSTTLDGSLACASAPGLTIGASNITLDGAGYSLTGPGSGNGIVIPSYVQNVTVKNLTLSGWGAVGSLDAAINISGSYPSSAGNHTILNNTITGSARGIWLIYTNGNTLSGNAISSSYYNGIQSVFTTNNNTISGNVISLTTNGSGITMGGSGNVITGNTVNSNSDIGIYFEGTGHTLTGNTVSSNAHFGIHVGGSSHTLSDNTVNSNGYNGIYLFYGVTNSTLSGNTASFNGWSGIVLWAYNSNNTVTGNTTSNNQGGIGLYYDSNNNTVSGNTVSGNTGFYHAGIRILSASGNTVYHNNIIGNVTQASDTNPASNDWHEPTLLEGNFWSDYTGLDNGSGTGKHAIAGDGIGDTLIPHPAAGFDFYPFVNPSGWERPVANAGPDQTVNEGNVVTLDGSGSSDPLGKPLTFQWTQIAGPPVTLNLNDPVHPTFVAPSVPAGGATLTFQLTVSDGTLTSEPDTVDIVAKNVNTAPVADAGADQIVNEGSPVTLDGSNSFDPDGETLTYSWVQTVGPSVSLSDFTAAKPTFTAPLVSGAGVTLTFELTVSDGIDSAADTVNVFVENVNHLPIANAGADQTKNEGALVTLDGTGSSDPDSDPLTYAWTQISGAPVTLSDSHSPTPSFTAPLVGPGGATLVFQLVVNDGLGDSPFDDVTVTALNVNDPPVCGLARPTLTTLWPPNHKLISVGIVGVTDPDNNQVTITITGVTQDEPVNGLGDGDTSPDAVIQGSTVLLRAERSGKGNGRVYRVNFTANDGQGGMCTGAVKVSVPDSMKPGMTAVDDGQLYDSTQP